MNFYRMFRARNYLDEQSQTLSAAVCPNQFNIFRQMLRYDP